MAQPGSVTHQAFRDLPTVLQPGDVLVVNTSATLAAAVDGVRADGRLQPVHVSAELDDGQWVVELRRADGKGPSLRRVRRARSSRYQVMCLRMRSRLTSPLSQRLWRATPISPVDRIDYLARYGQADRLRLSRATRSRSPTTRTCSRRTPGSAEMASAGRPFTAELLVRLMAAGVTVAPLTLHCGVSSPELHEPPHARAVRRARGHRAHRQQRGLGRRRIVAVGTTVVRALETVATDDGTVRPGKGWTDLVLGPDHPARVVNGLFTGLHTPEASHLLLLEAVAGPELVQQAYEAAVPQGYLWHEFGDSMLFLP